MCAWSSSKMWDFHAKCVKFGRSGGAQKLQSGMHTATIICKGKTQTVLKLLMHRPYISILMHKHSVFMKLETKFRDWVFYFD